MKKCPNCGNDVHDKGTACSECGARWNEDGTYAGVPELPPSLDPARARKPASETVRDMSPKELRHEIMWGVFTAQVLFTLVIMLIYGMIFFAFAGCAASSFD